MNKSINPIGIFDSGIGGISLLKQAVKLLPNENYIYFGDNLNAPYGPRKEQEIQELSLSCAHFLNSKNVKAIVIACNTATSASVKIMRERYNLPVISIEPAVKPAMENIKNGELIVLATTGTISLNRYKKLLKRLHADKKVTNVPCMGLVEIIEKGDLNSDEINLYIEQIFKPYLSKKVDAVVLGCTHYSFIKDNIQKYLDKNLDGERQIYDGNLGTVKQLERVLIARDILNKSNKKGNVEFFSSGGQRYVNLMNKIFYSE
jgi:glutamate racemase